jgi:hypothetical protein
MINNSKNVIEIITVLHKAHQIYMEVRKTPLRDRDGLGDQACLPLDLAPLQARHQIVTSLERLRHTNLDEIIQREASLLL